MVEEYSMRMTKEWPSDLAISATYVRDTQRTMAVIYGCEEEHKKNIIARLRRAGNAVAHPMLIVGIFAELARKRLFSLVDDLVETFLQRTEALGNKGRAWRQILNSEGEKPGDLLQIYNDSRSRIRALNIAKVQVSKMIAHSEELAAEIGVGKAGGDQKRKTDSAYLEYERQTMLDQADRQIRERLDELLDEYDRKIEDCRMVQEDLSAATQMVAGHLARRETELSTNIALRAKRDNAQMKWIALLGMIYLPVSSVAVRVSG